MYKKNIFLDGDLLKFLGMQEIRPVFRLLKDMKSLFEDPSMDEDDEVLYAMYRNVVLPQHKPLFDSMNLRHDITVLPVKFVCREYVKTFGHFHPGGFSEVYQVLEGKCHFLLQKDGDFVIISASEGDIVVFPGDYGHVATNPYGKPLVMANIVSGTFSSDYSLYEKMKGAAYYDTTGGLFKNTNYASVTEPRITEPNGASLGPDIYDAFVQNPERFAFLSNPSQNKFRVL